MTERGIGSGVSWTESAGLAVAVALALLGIVAIVRSPIPAGPWFLWLVPLVVVVVAAPVAGLPRYRTPADPVLLMLAAIGAVWAADRLVDVVRRKRRFLGSAAAVILGALVLAGCGGGDSDEPAAPEQRVPTSESDPGYASEANAICRKAVQETRELGQELLATGGSSSEAIELTTEDLIAPGIEIRERQAERLRRLDPPADPDPFLVVYLDIFEPLGELSQQRLEAGRAQSYAKVSQLEDLMLDLANEQTRAARRAGLDDCAVDFVAEALTGGS